MLVVQIAAGVVLGVLVLAWLDQSGRRQTEERRHGAQERIWAREAILEPMVMEVYKWLSRESSSYYGNAEWPVPATPLQQIIADEMQRRRAKSPFENWLKAFFGRDSSLGCGPQRRAAEWPRSRRRPNGIRAT